ALPPTLFPGLQTHAPTLPPVGPANRSPQNRPSLPCPSSLIPHSPLHCRRSHSRDFVPCRFSDACCCCTWMCRHAVVRETFTKRPSRLLLHAWWFAIWIRSRRLIKKA